MPRFPVSPSPVSKVVYTNAFVDYTGNVATVTLNVPDTVTDGELLLVGQAMGDVTNAGAFRRTTSRISEIKQTSATAFDEAENNANTKAELVFQDDNLVTRSVSIPAPDAQFILPGDIIDNSGDMATLITNIENVLNGGVAGSGTFAYSRGYIVNRTRKVTRGKTIPQRAEPGALDEPGDAPSV